MLLLRCPKCKNTMKYQAVKLTGKNRKLCVYCGHSFKVLSSVVKRF